MSTGLYAELEEELVVIDILQVPMGSYAKAIRMAGHAAGER